MAMMVQHNLLAFNAVRQLGIASKTLTKSSEKLSSGYRVNRSADDASGLAISEKMRRQIRGLNQGTKNMQDGVSLCQVADGALVETHSILQRMNELCIQAANGTNSLSDRTAIQEEIDRLTWEVDRIAWTTTFNEHIHPLYERGNGRTTINHMESEDLTREVTHTFWGTKFGEDELQYGDFYVTTRGVRGVDYEYDAANRLFTILSDKDIQITTKGVTTNQDHILVADGVAANVCLRDCMIDVSRSGNVAAFKIADDSAADVTVTLRGDNQLSSGLNCAGLQKNGETAAGTLVLQGTGKLTAKGYDGAGIGGGKGQSTNNIRITSGTIDASVRCTSHSTCAGIGGGGDRDANSVIHGHGNNIEIAGGNVYARGSDDSAGIGGSYNGGSTGIRITGGYVKSIADYGMSSIPIYGAAIGSGMPNTRLAGHPERQGSTVSIDPSVRITSTFAPVATPGTYGIQGKLLENALHEAIYYWFECGTEMTYTEEPEPIVLITETEYIIEKSSSVWGESSGEAKKPIRIQMGADATDGLYMNLVDASSKMLGINGLRLLSSEDACASIDKVASAINTVSGYRSFFGAMQNRFESAMRMNDNTAENLQYSESCIRDLDYAQEMVNFAKSQIVMSVAESMLSQANQNTKDVLYLLSSVA